MSDVEIDPVQFGRVLAEVERGAEDRRNLTTSLDQLWSEINGIRRDIAALTQTTNSAAHGLHELLKQDLGARVSKLEAATFSPENSNHGPRLMIVENQITVWRNWIGGTRSALFKLAGILLGCSALQAVFVKWLLEHFH